MHLLFRPIQTLGSSALNLLEFLGHLGYLLRDTLAQIPRGLLAKRSRRLGWQNLWSQMER